MRIEDVRWAAEVFGLSDRASMRAIKGRYRELMARWHPDSCCEDPKDLCNEMAQKINRAYEIILSYCDTYEYPFGEEDLKREEADESYERWWRERFGDDPLWGGTGNREAKRDREPRSEERWEPRSEER